MEKTNSSLGNGEMSSQENSFIFKKLLKRSQKWSIPIDSFEFARKLDEEDPLRQCRSLFHYPKKEDISGVHINNNSDGNEECIYFCGQSLGLQLKSTISNVNEAMKNWATRGVDSHFTGDFPAVFSDQIVKEKMSKLVGAEPNEIAVMNGLTVNIQIMLATFYKPTAERNKILMVDGGFHSDWYAVQSHLKLRSFDPEESIILLKPEKGEHTISLNKILSVIKNEGDHIALIYLEGVHYYTGQRFDMETITKAAHNQGCIVGFDLAHAVGNIKLKLHEWNIDFAVWCTYKYLNSGPGNMGAIFCHSKHTQSPDQVIPALQGWWGLDIKRKFAFDKDFTPAEGADRFRMSNPSPVLCSMISANLDVFNEIGMEKIQEKQVLITGYLEYLLIENITNSHFQNPHFPQIQIITPHKIIERGSQLSLLSSVSISHYESILKAHGIVCDIRMPSVLRVTPAPLYNTYVEVYKFVQILKNIWETIQLNENGEK